MLLGGDDGGDGGDGGGDGDGGEWRKMLRCNTRHHQQEQFGANVGF